jgi:hypothetical protein
VIGADHDSEAYTTNRREDRDADRFDVPEAGQPADSHLDEGAPHVRVETIPRKSGVSIAGFPARSRVLFARWTRTDDDRNALICPLVSSPACSVAPSRRSSHAEGP